jgi:salicylate hydroxylase
MRARLGHRAQPQFSGYTAWRALVPAEALPAEFSAPAVNLWLSDDAHLVHYPVKGGSVINVVAIARDTWREPGWNAPGFGAEILTRFSARDWPARVRALLAAAAHWHKWALQDCSPLSRWGNGPATLLGDAAHPMLPYLAQGAAMAIEDAAILGECMRRTPGDPTAAMRAYETQRMPRTRRTQRAARRNGAVYHLRGPAAWMRSLALMAMGEGLISRYDWLYSWKPH